MSKPALVFWALNRIASWNYRPMIEALSSRYDVVVGQRVLSTAPSAGADIAINATENGRLGELMFEGDPGSYDCYFVPIPTKTVGAAPSPFWRSVGGNADRLGDIIAHSQGRHGVQGQKLGMAAHNPATAKTAIGAHFGRVRMNLADLSVGYYEILQRATRQTGGALNVLIGYSQGGTVARYLAFLDEHVASPEHACIHGIITVQSPNAGSPVASAAKKLDVGRALAGVLLSLIRWLPPDYPSQPVWAALSHASAIDAINTLLDALLHSWPASGPSRHPAASVWLTARKWLSGLEGIPDLAFWDLDPARLAEPGSVLHSIAGANYPLNRIRHGAVVGTDGSLDDFVATLLKRAPWPVRIAARWKHAALARLLEQAEAVYRDEVMGGGDHDFVIPSASQRLGTAQPPANPAHLGDIAVRSNHISGAAGADLPAVVEILGRM